MFTIINVHRRKDTLGEKIFGGLRRDDYQLKTVAVYKGAPFYVMDIRVGKKGINTEKIIVSVGKCARRIITNDYNLFPQSRDIEFFKSDLLYKKMLHNTFTELLKKNCVNENLVSICLIDKCGTEVEFAEKLSAYSSTLTIVTDRKEKYTDTVELITEETGLCPVLRKEPADAEIIINCDMDFMRIKSSDQRITVIDKESFTVPEIYNYLKPDGIDKYDFYSALYELSGVFSLAEGVFENISVNNEKKSLEDIHFS